MKRLKTMTIFIFVAGFLLLSGSLDAQLLLLPDLTIKKVGVDKACRLYVVVQNAGRGPLPARVYTQPHPKSAGVYVYINGQGWGGITIKGFDTRMRLRRPGGVATCYLSYRVTNSPVKVKAVVDLHNDVRESSEKNNEMVQSVRCKGIPPRPEFMIYNIKMSPKSPAYLALDQKVNITFDYYSAAKVYIWARPFSGNSLTPSYAAHPSPLYASGRGKGTGFFMITKGKGIIDRVRFQMMDSTKKKLYYQKYVAVKYKFPTVQISIAKTPKRFFLDFVDAYLVYEHGKNTLQIATENNMLSYGGDWQRAKIKDYLYDLKEKFWENFFWRVNTSRKEVYRVRNGSFGKIGGSFETLTNISVDVVGDGRNPTRFFLRFKKAYLVYTPGSKTLQIAAMGNSLGNVLSYGSDWQKCNMKSYLYHLKQNVWKGFYWKINTSREEAYRVTGGKFCELGGSGVKLKMGVRVVY